MAVHVILWIIASILAGIAIPPLPVRFNLIAAALCFGFAGFAFQALGA